MKKPVWLEIPDIFYSSQFWIIIGFIILLILLTFFVIPEFMNMEEKMCEWCAENC